MWLARGVNGTMFAERSVSGWGRDVCVFFCAWQSLYDKIIYSFDPRVNLYKLLCIYFLSAPFPCSSLGFFPFGLFAFGAQTPCRNHRLFHTNWNLNRYVFGERMAREFAMMLMLLYYYFLPFPLTFARPAGLSLFWILLASVLTCSVRFLLLFVP